MMVDEYISIARAREIFLEGMAGSKDACPYERRNERLMWEAGKSQALASASAVAHDVASAGVNDAVHDETVGQPTSE